MSPYILTKYSLFSRRKNLQPCHPIDPSLPKQYEAHAYQIPQEPRLSLNSSLIIR